MFLPRRPFGDTGGGSHLVAFRGGVTRQAGLGDVSVVASDLFAARSNPALAADRERSFAFTVGGRVFGGTHEAIALGGGCRLSE